MQCIGRTPAKAADVFQEQVTGNARDREHETEEISSARRNHGAPQVGSENLPRAGGCSTGTQRKSLPAAMPVLSVFQDHLPPRHGVAETSSRLHLHRRRDGAAAARLPMPPRICLPAAFTAGGEAGRRYRRYFMLQQILPHAMR